MKWKNVYFMSAEGTNEIVKPVLVVTSIKQPTCIKQPEESCLEIHRHIFELY